MKLRRMISFICVAVLLLEVLMVPSSAKNVEDVKEFKITTQQKNEILNYNEKFEKVAENDLFTLSVDKKNTNIALLDKNSKTTYYSSPIDTDKDFVATSTVKDLMESFLIIKYAQRDSGIITKGSKKNSVAKKSAYIENIKNGIHIDFYFPLEKIYIPVEILLTNSGIEVKVLSDGISENDSKFKLSSIQVMPYFGCTKIGENGYTFIPDGCGAVIENSKNNSGFSSYSKPVYGRDLSIMLDSQTYDKSKIYLPVFGLKINDSGFVGIIKNGDTNAKINATAPGTNNSYNSICSEFVFRQTENVVYQTNNNMGWMNLTEFETEHFKGDYVVEYSFISLGADYSKMAEVYRDYLLNNNKLKKSQYVNKETLYVDLIGGAKRQESFFGIPVKRVTSITPFDSVSKISDALNKAGIDNITYRYKYWQKGADSQAIYNNVCAERRLGGDKKLKSLLKTSKGENFRIVLDINFMNMNRSASGLSKKYDSVQSMRKEPIVNYLYRINTETIDKSISDTYLVNPLNVLKIANKLSKKLQKLDAGGYSLNSIGSLLYSDFGKKSTSRKTSAEAWGNIASTIKKSGSLLLEAPNAYMIEYADEIINSPSSSEQNNIFSYDVPFYQLVLSGYIPTSLEAGNSFGNDNYNLLKSVEYGSNLKFDLGYKNIDLLYQTGLSKLNYIDYSLWVDGIAKDYSKWYEFREITDFTAIKCHRRLMTNVYLSEYENGIKVYTNYNNNAVTVGNINIPAMDFALEEDVFETK